MSDRDLERKAERAELLLHAARQLGDSSLEPERVYERFHELLRDVVQHDGIVVSSYDERDNLIRCEYGWVEGNVIDPSTLPPLPLNRSGRGMQSQVIVTGEPALFNDVAERVQREGEYYNVDREGKVEKIPDAGPARTTAAMMVPVKESNAVVGVVQLMSDGGAYDEDQLELVQGLVAQMAAAVRNARLQKERRRLEAAEAAARAVAAEREQAAQVLEAVGDGIFFVDNGGVVRLWNRAAALITGFRSERVCGRPLVETIPDWAALSGRIPVTDRGEASAPVTLPVEVGGRDLWLSFVAVRSSDGVVYAFRDLTAERRLEEEKSDFVATISHELRTPMAAVYGAAQTLLRRDVELNATQTRQLLEMIASQSTRLSQITEEVLLTNRLDRGEVSVAREPVDVADLVRRTVDAMASNLSHLPAVEVEVAPGTGAASCDADRVEQVVVNLLDNAVKYGRGPVHVRVESANSHVRISVADSGPGISLADQQRIFEKFFRADPAQARAPGGTGLGLYISRELVRRMGGRLDVSSEPGAGATFVVELPKA